MFLPLQMDLLMRVGWRLRLDPEEGVPPLLLPLLLLPLPPLLLLAGGGIPLSAFPTASHCTASPLLRSPLPWLPYY
jgi:hypothetical protein